MILLKIILFIFLFFYLLKLLANILIPHFLKKYIENISQKERFNHFEDEQEERKKEGEITIEYTNKKSKKSVNNNDEYVDYEEI